MGEGVWETSGGIISFTSSHTSIIDGSTLPPRARRYYTEEEAGRGRIDMNAPFLRSGLLLENALMIYVFITIFCVFDANTFSDNLFILTQKKTHRVVR